jgi:hypothetical protein
VTEPCGYFVPSHEPFLEHAHRVRESDQLFLLCGHHDNGDVPVGDDRADQGVDLGFRPDVDALARFIEEEQLGTR